MWNDSMSRPATSTLLRISAAALTALGVLLASAALADEKPTSSLKLAKPLKQAHDDLDAKKYSDAIQKLRDAEGIAGKTSYDQHLINDMLGFAYIRTENFPEAAKALEAELNDGFTSPADARTRVRWLAQINYQIKNYDKAIQYGTRAIKAGDLTPVLDTLVGQAYYLKRDYRGTQVFCEERVRGELDRSWTPKRESLQLLYGACVKLKDQECVRRALEWLDKYYPGMYLNSPSLDSLPSH